jgi:hypothetical protein
MSVSVLSRPTIVERLMAERDEARARVAELEARLAEAERLWGGVMTFGSVVVDPAQMLVLIDGQSVDLTATEWNLLLYLAQRAGALCANAAILSAVWGPAYADDMHLLRVNLSRLRYKLRPYAGLIETRVGLGHGMPAPSSVAPGPIPFVPSRGRGTTHHPLQDLLETSLRASPGVWKPVHQLAKIARVEDRRRKPSHICKSLTSLARRRPGIELRRDDDQITAARMVAP